MTDTAPGSATASLTSTERDLLNRVPDEEQRSILYRELLRKRGIDNIIDLSVAENALTYTNLCKGVFNDMPRPIPERYTRYLPPYGTPPYSPDGTHHPDDLRVQMADRLNHSFGVDTVEYKDIFGTSGVSSALQAIALGLQQNLGNNPAPVPAGNKVLLPSPFWQGFRWSFGQTPQLKLVMADLAKKEESKFQLTLKDLQDAYDNEPDPKPKLLALTNPHNPLGMNYDESLLDSIYDWALGGTHMHIISDEMYVHSQLTNAQPNFVSALKYWGTNESAADRVHVVWGFAKDFGLSGFKAGFIISKSEYVSSAILGSHDPLESRVSLSWFMPFDSLKHFYILRLLAKGGDFWENTMEQYKIDLTDSFNAVACVLDKYCIKYVHQEGANSAQFFWLDLREFLKPPATTISDSASILFGSQSPCPNCSEDDQGEQALADLILTKTNVKLLTGSTMYCSVPGYFRLCFTAHEKKTVVEAVENMCKFLGSILNT